MKRIFLVFCAIVCALSVGCDGQAGYATFSDYAQGTTYTIVVKDPAEGLEGRIDSLFKEIDLTFSMFDPQSLVSRINRGETTEITTLFKECFDLAKETHSVTEGYFDPTVKPLVDAWGFGPGEQQEHPCVECLMEYVGMDKIGIEGERIVKKDRRVQLDFSSIAKGFTVDKIAEMLDAEGTTDYMVEVGGEVRVKGVNEAGRNWRIGIDKPVMGLAREIEAVAVPDDSFPAIATSGNYRNHFTDEAGLTRVHTIDPLTGYPAEGDILSVSLASAQCARADAWATAIMASRTVENALRLLSAAGADSDVGSGSSSNSDAHSGMVSDAGSNSGANSDSGSGSNANPDSDSGKGFRADRTGIEYFIIHSLPDGATSTIHSAGFPLADN